MGSFPDFAKRANLELIEQFYQKYLEDKASVDSSWRAFFEGIDFAGFLHERMGVQEVGSPILRIAALIQAYRTHGYLAAQVDPLGKGEGPVEALSLKELGFSDEELKVSFPTLGLLSAKEATLEEILAALQKIYTGSIGFEYMNLCGKPEERWIQSQIEAGASFSIPQERKAAVLQELIQADALESFLHVKYQGQTRFSLEGHQVLLPMLKEIAEEAATEGVDEIIFGSSHRGRLNLLAHLFSKPYEILFKEFEDTILYGPDEMSDVKYHKGFAADLPLFSGKKMRMILSPNSSCLESTNAIVLGQTKAKQVIFQDEKGEKAMALLLHGDAALAGQGVVYETLQMGRCRGFSTGGTIHIAVNNQIGYTTLPMEGRSTRFATDIAKAFSIPIFHVNAEDVEASLFVAALALRFRQTFHTDVFIDLIGYRKHGHNEGDEPTFTQPTYYEKLKEKASLTEEFKKKLLQEGSVDAASVEKMEKEVQAKLSEAFEKGKVEEKIEWEKRVGQGDYTISHLPKETLFERVETGVKVERLQEILKSFSTVPEGFSMHPKLQKWLEMRREISQMSPDERAVDWSAAECLAFGSLALEKIAVRLAGQDVMRGTFSQRHAVWFDQKTAERYAPFSHLGQEQARVDIYNTILSEYGAMGFELGYNWVSPKTLCIWEAQYGDFVIGAEIIIDQYLSASEEKWGISASLVLLLPHGYEGAGPEHSSGRIERFLELAANQNLQVVYPTTPHQYFHLLRRQAIRKIRRPLVVFTPKSLLRHPMNKATLSELSTGAFQEFLDDPEAKSDAKKILFCSGKIYYDLLSVRKELGDIALIRIEQIYPFCEKGFKELLAKYSQASRWIWVQEEPENMGAAPFLSVLLPRLGRPVEVIARRGSSSTATGSKKRHAQEMREILERVRQ